MFISKEIVEILKKTDPSFQDILSLRDFLPQAQDTAQDVQVLFDFLKEHSEKILSFRKELPSWKIVPSCLIKKYLLLTYLGGEPLIQDEVLSSFDLMLDILSGDTSHNNTNVHKRLKAFLNNADLLHSQYDHVQECLCECDLMDRLNVVLTEVGCSRVGRYYADSNVKKSFCIVSNLEEWVYDEKCSIYIVPERYLKTRENIITLLVEVLLSKLSGQDVYPVEFQRMMKAVNISDVPNRSYSEFLSWCLKKYCLHDSASAVIDLIDVQCEEDRFKNDVLVKWIDLLLEGASSRVQFKDRMWLAYRNLEQYLIENRKNQLIQYGYYKMALDSECSHPKHNILQSQEVVFDLLKNTSPNCLNYKNVYIGRCEDKSGLITEEFVVVCYSVEEILDLAGFITQELSFLVNENSLEVVMDLKLAEVSTQMLEMLGKYNKCYHIFPTEIDVNDKCLDELIYNEAFKGFLKELGERVPKEKFECSKGRTCREKSQLGLYSFSRDKDLAGEFSVIDMLILLGLIKIDNYYLCEGFSYKQKAELKKLLDERPELFGLKAYSRENDLYLYDRILAYTYFENKYTIEILSAAGGFLIKELNLFVVSENQSVGEFIDLLKIRNHYNLAIISGYKEGSLYNLAIRLLNISDEIEQVYNLRTTYWNRYNPMINPSTSRYLRLREVAQSLKTNVYAQEKKSL